MKKTLEELLNDYAEEKRAFRAAQNQSRFLALWPEIKAMLDKGWSLKAINEVTKAYGLLNLHYDSFRRYVIKQRKMEGTNNSTSTPNKKVQPQDSLPTLKREEKGETKNGGSDEKPPYRTPPQFGNLHDYKYNVL